MGGEADRLSILLYGRQNRIGLRPPLLEPGAAFRKVSKFMAPAGQGMGDAVIVDDDRAGKQIRRRHGFKSAPALPT
jgi:hypothetical protein